MNNTNDNHEKLELEDLEDINGGFSARQMMAAASLAFMGSSFADQTLLLTRQIQPNSSICFCIRK